VSAAPRAPDRILRLARRGRRARLAVERGPLLAAKAVVVAPLRAAREALRAVRRYGRVTAEDAGVSPVRQFAWMWWLNLRHDYGADAVYRHRLFSRDRVTPGALFMPEGTARLLYRTVVPRVDRRAAEILSDKRRFAAWCAAEGLPTAPVLAEFEGGRLTRLHVAVGEAPRADLFAKWGAQYGGGDTQRWRYEAGIAEADAADAARYVDDAGRAWKFPELLDALAERSRAGVVLLQPRLVNHAALRPLSPHALSTIRVMTTRRPGEAPRLFAGLLRMGTGTSTADNFAQGGIASAADPATGVIGPARRVDADHRTQRYETHPDTGAQIAGVRVPSWDAAVGLALDAHARLGPIPAVGWDVAVLADGPVLLEGNWNPCVKLLQVATQTPLLATEFAAVYAAWLDDPACAMDDRTFIAQAAWEPSR
jgi:hypothetical protein